MEKKFDIIYLDTIHTAKHVEKIFNIFDRLNVMVYLLLTIHLCYLTSKNREKNNFSLEVNNYETFQKLIEIFNSNHQNLYFESIFYFWM